MRTELAYPPAPLQGSPPGLPRPLPGQAAGDALGADSGTDPAACANMSATGPDRSPRPCPPLRKHVGREPGPVAGFARPLKGAARQRNRVGCRLPG